MVTEGSDPLAAAIKRNTRLLAIAQGLVYTAAPIVLATGGPAAVELTGRASSVGAMVAAFFLAASAAAPLAGRWMDRSGRRPGLVAGHGAVVVGALVAALAVSRGSPTLLFAGSAILGAGTGAASLGRAAVADMYPPAKRGRAVGLVLAASTIGAVGGAPLVAVVQTLSDRAGLDRLVTPWLLVPFFGIAAVIAIIRLRPDPRDLAVGATMAAPPVDPAAASDTYAAVAGTADPVPAEHAPDHVPETASLPVRSRRELLRNPAFRVALVAAAVAQAAMVAVMAVAPVVVHDHGGGDVGVSIVLMLHFAGMFALMPAIGWALDRWGRRRGLLAAAAVCLLGVPLGGAGAATVFVAIAMFCAGLGWAGAYLGSTAIVSDVTAPNERAGALGLMDLVVSLCSGAGGFLGGLLLEAGGYALVTLVAGVVFVPVLAMVLPLREPSPGHWVARRVRPAVG